MLTETLILASHRTPTDSIDAPSISVYDLHTSHLQHSYKRSHTSPRGLAVTNTHVFTAQSDKSVINIYSLSPGGRLESTIPFPTRITVLSASPSSAFLALGTDDGRVYTWELSSTRLTATPQTHLQPVTALTFDRRSTLLMSGGADAAINVWSVSGLLDIRDAARTPERTLSRHTRGITALATGRASSGGPADILFSASEDGSVVAWDPHVGAHLRTFVLSSVPRCLALDPADRALYVGLQSGAVHIVDLYDADADAAVLFPRRYQDVPVSLPEMEAGGGSAPVVSVAVGYEGNLVVVGDEGGEVTVRDAETGRTVRVVANLKAPVTGLVLVGPFTDEGVKVPVIPKPRYDAILAATSARTYRPAEYSMRVAWKTVPDGTMGPERDMEFIREGARAMERIGGEKVKVERVQRLEGELERLYGAYERLSEVQKRTWEALVESKTSGEK